MDAIIQTSIGQGETQITPLLLNMITQAIANEGVVMKPLLVDQIKSADGRVLGKMGHSERMGANIGKNIPYCKDQKLFESGVRYYQ